MTCPGGGRPPAAVRWPCSNHSMRPGHGLDPGPRDTWPWLCHHVTRRPQRLSSWVPGHVPCGQSSWWQEVWEPPGGPAPDPSPPEGPAAWWEGTVGPHPGQDQAGVHLHTDSGRSWRQRPAVAEVCGDGPRPLPVAKGLPLGFHEDLSAALKALFETSTEAPPPATWMGHVSARWARGCRLVDPSVGRHPPAAAWQCTGPDASRGYRRGWPLLSTP